MHIVVFSPKFGECFAPSFFTRMRVDNDLRRSLLRARAAYAVLVGAATLWCSAIVAAPLLHNGPWESLSAFLYRFFQPICNQLDSHSFHLHGEKTAVCIRCTSIYFSFLAGLLVYPFVRSLAHRSAPGRGWLFIGIAPMVVDVALSLLGVHESTALSRILSGSFFGVIAVFIVVPTLVDAIADLQRKTRVRPSLTNTKD